MHIDWAALGTVAVVSIVSSVDLHDLAGERHSPGLGRQDQIKPRWLRAPRPYSLGYVLLGLAGLLVLFGIYLIIPQFH